MAKKFKKPLGKFNPRISIVHGIDSFIAWPKDQRNVTNTLCLHFY